jgi:hypothetical protein
MDRKLFELTVGTPALTDKIAYGNATESKNITVADFKTLIVPAAPSFKSIIIPLNGWNMASYGYSLVALGGLFDNSIIQRIRGIKVIIKNDAETTMTDLLSVQNGTALTSPQIYAVLFPSLFGGTLPCIFLQRRTGCLYATNGEYVSDSGSRGWLLMDYVE